MNINPNRFELPEQVRKFLDNHNWDMKQFADSITDPSCTFHERCYYVDAPAEAAWRAYSETSPYDMWRGPKARLALLYESNTNQVYTADNAPPTPVVPGHVMFLYLKIDNFVRRCSAFRIAEINNCKRRIVLSYLKQNPTHGRQEITLHHAHRKKTLIRHRAWFRGSSGLYDRVFYPFYHSRVIDEYHRHIASNRELSCSPVRKKRKKRTFPGGS